MPSLSSNISAVLDLCGNPSTADYPNILGQSARIVNQVARMMMREARLSDQAQYLRFLTLTSPSKEQSIPSITDPNSICLAELLSDSVYDSRIDIPIVGREELNLKESQGECACARFGRPTKIRFTWNPDSSPISGLGSDQVIVGYEALPLLSETDLNSVPPLPESFHDVLCFRSAALITETILNKASGKILLDTMSKIEDQWRRWCDRSAEERPTLKGGFGSLDSYDWAES